MYKQISAVPVDHNLFMCQIYILVMFTCHIVDLINDKQSIRTKRVLYAWWSIENCTYVCLPNGHRDCINTLIIFKNKINYANNSLSDFFA